ncbi:MAG: hypothetical protein DMF64_17310 [Acidobacteria bacterium]|nr:MAG: hypothetical protein DMF64_17310 [Acidobacteriota bacterium]
MLMPDLSERIGCALLNPEGMLWLPNLTEELVSSGWQDLNQKCGLSPYNYSTDRVIACNIDAPCNRIALLSMLPNNQDENKTIKIDILSEGSAKQYEDADIRFYTEEEIRGSSVLSCVNDALKIMDRVPTLAATVVALASSLHLIKAKNDDYDVSFSEPDIPFSIFVSIPQENNSINTLRVAEAILHEAMHLQLTLIEKFVPLVTKTQQKIFSPWREEFRTIQGVLHALYVFRVIDKFLECLLSIQNHPVEKLEYIQQRRDEIEEQVNKIRSLQGHSELTMIGACFVQKLIQN